MTYHHAFCVRLDGEDNRMHRCVYATGRRAERSIDRCMMYAHKWDVGHVVHLWREGGVTFMLPDHACLAALITVAEGRPIVVRKAALCGGAWNESRNSPRGFRPPCEQCESVFAQLPKTKRAQEQACERLCYAMPDELEGVMRSIAEVRFATRLKWMRWDGQRDQFPLNWYGFPFLQEMTRERHDSLVRSANVPLGNDAFGDLMYPFVQRMSELAREQMMEVPTFTEEWMRAPRWDMSELEDE